MPTAFDPSQAVQTGLLGATGPVQVTVSQAQVDYFDYKQKDGTIKARTVAALVWMSPDGEVDDQGKPKSYQQMYSIGDVKTHSPNPEKSGFDGPLVKSSNFCFFIEQLINAGFPQHLLGSGDIRVLNGAVLVVEQRKPQKRDIKGQAEDTANKGVVVPVKVIHPAPGEDWPATGKAVTLVAQAGGSGGVKKAQAPPKAQAPVQPAPAAPTQVTSPVQQQAAVTVTGGDTDKVQSLAETIVMEIVTAAGAAGYVAKAADGSFAGEIGKKSTFNYMKKMQSDKENYPANLRGQVVAMIQNPEWLGSAERPWVYDPETGLLLGS